MKPKSNVVLGMTIAGFASLSWGISGTVLQLISQTLAIPAAWMLSTRTFFVGALLLIVGAVIYRGHIFDVFKTKASCLSVISYGIFGLAFNLFTFYYAVQTGNSSMATILQYLAPLFIVLGNLVFRGKKLPVRDFVAFVIALIGVILCITRGNLTHLSIPFVSLMWGIGSGITAAFYVVLPKKAAESNPPILVLGWGTMIAAILFNCMHPFWVQVPTLSSELLASVACVMLFGTILPFGLLIVAGDHAPSDIVSIMDALQPISTTILSVIFFKMSLNLFEIAGILIVIVAIYLLHGGRKQTMAELEELNE